MMQELLVPSCVLSLRHAAGDNNGRYKFRQVRFGRDAESSYAMASDGRLFVVARWDWRPTGLPIPEFGVSSDVIRDLRNRNAVDGTLTLASGEGDISASYNTYHHGEYHSITVQTTGLAASEKAYPPCEWILNLCKANIAWCKTKPPPQCPWLTRRVMKVLDKLADDQDENAVYAVGYRCQEIPEGVPIIPKFAHVWELGPTIDQMGDDVTNKGFRAWGVLMSMNGMILQQQDPT